MGNDSSSGPQRLASGASSSSAIATQHERLILELLPLRDAQHFRQWICGPFVRGSWDEFCRDFLIRFPGAPEPDKAKTTEAARNALNSKSTKYLACEYPRVVEEDERERPGVSVYG
jgi:hypothetical protein